MFTINLTDEQLKNLCNEITEVVFKFQNNKNIECIYMCPYVNLEEPRHNVVNITLVSSDYQAADKIHKKNIEINKKYNNEEAIGKFGARIVITVDDGYKFDKMALNPSEVVRMRDLYNSKILYDPTSKYQEIKAEAEKWAPNPKSHIEPYINAAKFNPEIDFTPNYSLAKKLQRPMSDKAKNSKKD